MTDQFDRASELEALHRDKALEALQNAKEPPLIIDGVRCIGCQVLYEISEKQRKG
ncbi:hypothetical protein SG34_010510 [Thalassomonas viridans]|uniref:Uncharacterized protein n=1 Tax=Thalassomonas viridans TaxID=137584 RepID=A0AAE9Z630_9GAMM|nr:hypothetical protein [Thalassomonas viridans]WDE07278.1 hypothetical protein SG34_010510 [Thalassomonas viridans]